MSSKYWYYQINVREGNTGFADDAQYKSQNFNSFEECFKSYVNFKPLQYWTNLRHIQKEIFVFVNDDITHINIARNGILHYDDSEIELGITECEFDKIIDSINKKQ